jgi:hypothetical protein
MLRGERCGKDGEKGEEGEGENISAVRTGIRTSIGHPRLLLRVLVTVYI